MFVELSAIVEIELKWQKKGEGDDSMWPTKTQPTTSNIQGKELITFSATLLHENSAGLVMLSKL